ncbi:hypothetical protein [Sphingomonas lacusdianchii]|uniref:hypothetical protein n=1 Tax=Sphingomonas lacusdianchii TaxID=2917992 RepID=UPI001F577F3B|nr:hypothetical protein [Sphingomonas sp. JXJ CY 53]
MHLSAPLVRRCLIATAILTATAATAPPDPWRIVERRFFPGPAVSDARGQGVTTDGVHWIFSGTRSLERVDGDFRTLRIDRSAIPARLWRPSRLSPIGLNHIGDIDYANGLLYVPLDSSHADAVVGKAYAHPVVALYDARTFRYTGRAYPLRPPHGTDDIASWIAVDPVNATAYGMTYHQASELAVYSLPDFAFRRYLPLSRPIDEAQGGKVRDGWIYLATDGDDKTVQRANLITGTVETLASLRNAGDQEIEGLSFHADANGKLSLNVLSREDDRPGSGQGGIALYRLEPWEVAGDTYPSHRIVTARMTLAR